jgi:3-oxoacid CoA-transferase subunit A
MIYISGDIHGETFRVKDAVEKLRITAEDTIVLLGDVGLNYFVDRRKKIPSKVSLNRLGIPILCIHGNHERRPETISSYHEMSWRGGTVYVETAYPNLLFTKDGEVYDLEGFKAIAIGGAYSVDKWYRIQHNLHWFPDEQPSPEIKSRVEQKLEESGWKIDFVFSHTCPERYIPRERFLPGVDQSTVDNSTEKWLDSIAERLDYNAWYCGHWHTNKRVDKMYFLFDGWVST